MGYSLGLLSGPHDPSTQRVPVAPLPSPRTPTRRSRRSNHSMCPCHRAVASTPPRWDAASVRFRHPMLPSPSDDGLGPRILHFRGYICVYCCYGPVSRNLPKGDLVDGLSGPWEIWTPRNPAIRTTGLLTFALAGLSPAEHTSLHWSLRPSCAFAPVHDPGRAAVPR